jgi:hypothetical protein
MERVNERPIEVTELSDEQLDAVAGGYKWDEGCRRSAIRDGSATVVLPPLKP